MYYSQFLSFFYNAHWLLQPIWELNQLNSSSFSKRCKVGVQKVPNENVYLLLGCGSDVGTSNTVVEDYSLLSISRYVTSVIVVPRFMNPTKKTLSSSQKTVVIIFGESL